MPMNLVIQERRRALNLTQEQVAGCLGVSTPAVNKWERGVTSPDLALLPPLARLLKVDLNTLFCFRESLTEQEIDHFSNQLYHTIEQEGIQEGFALAREKLREYPNCDLLRYTAAQLLQGKLLLSDSSQEEKEVYLRQISEWYEKCAQSEDQGIRNKALFLLASGYLQEHNWEKAQEALEQVPERISIDKRLLQADLLVGQGKGEEAAERIQRLLLTVVTELQTVLLKLTDLELAGGNRQQAMQVAEVSRKMVELFGLWEYNAYVAGFQVAVQEQDTEESLRLLRLLLSAGFTVWDLRASPLYSRIAAKPAEGVWKTILPPLLLWLKREPEFGFLWENQEFQALLEEYEEKAGNG